MAPWPSRARVPDRPARLPAPPPPPRVLSALLIDSRAALPAPAGRPTRSITVTLHWRASDEGEHRPAGAREGAPRPKGRGRGRRCTTRWPWSTACLRRPEQINATQLRHNTVIRCHECEPVGRDHMQIRRSHPACTAAGPVGQQTTIVDQRPTSSTIQSFDHLFSPGCRPASWLLRPQRPLAAASNPPVPPLPPRALAAS